MIVFFSGTRCFFGGWWNTSLLIGEVFEVPMVFSGSIFYITAGFLAAYPTGKGLRRSLMEVSRPYLGFPFRLVAISRWRASTSQVWWRFVVRHLYLGGGNSKIFYFHPYLRKWSNLTNIFQMGWNHQLVIVVACQLTNFWVFGTWSWLASDWIPSESRFAFPGNSPWISAGGSEIPNNHLEWWEKSTNLNWLAGFLKNQQYHPLDWFVYLHWMVDLYGIKVG